MNIKPAPLQYLPLELMKRHRIVPFEFDSERRALRIASSTPHDTALASELSRQSGGVKIELYPANPEAIERVIARFSTATGESAPSPSGGKIPHETLSPKMGEPLPEPKVSPEPLPGRAITESKREGSILFVTSSRKLSDHLIAALRSERYILKVAVSVEFALSFIESEPFEYIFVDDKLRDRATPLVKKVRQDFPATTVRYYRSEAALLVNDTLEEMTDDLLRKNLALFRFLYSRGGGTLARHESTVAQLTEILSARYDLPGHIRAAVATAAYLHNLSEDDLNPTRGYSQTDIIALSATRLASWQYPSLVVNILKAAYQPLSQLPRHISELELLAGSILTAVDIYCHNFPSPSSLSPEQMTQVREVLQREKEKIALDDVINQLLGAIADEVSSRSTRSRQSCLHILVPRGMLPKSLEEALSKADFKVEYSRSAAECADAFNRAKPQMMLIRHSGRVEEIYDLLLQLALQGVPLDQIPTLLMVDQTVLSEAMVFMKNGLEDIFSENLEPEIVVTKLSRIRNRLEEKAQYRRSVLQELGTHGSLEDMGLIDLLEASRGGSRPVQISISGEGQQATLYLEQGKVLYAECGTDSGVDAVSKIIRWRKGVWSIDPIDASKLPPANLNRGIDSILLEACVNIDTVSK